MFVFVRNHSSFKTITEETFFLLNNVTKRLTTINCFVLDPKEVKPDHAKQQGCLEAFFKVLQSIFLINDQAFWSQLKNVILFHAAEILRGHFFPFIHT